MRGLEEMDMLLRNIGDHYKELGDNKSARIFHSKSRESASRAQIIHNTVLQQNQYSDDIRLNKETESPDAISDK